MEKKTNVHAEEGQHDIVITRTFDLPLELLFRAYTDADVVAQWMGTKVLKLESEKFGAYEFQTSDPKGNVVFTATGVYHDFVPNEKIVRTFQMDNAGFEVQLEFLDFEALTEDTSKLTMHIIYRTVTDRDQTLKLPFAYGINMAHDRLQEIVSQLK